MSEKPEALEVAYQIETHVLFGSGSTISRTLLEKAAIELRRLHAENETLRRDAERYRYLRNRDPKEVLNKSGKAAGVWIDWEDDLSGLQLLTGDDADAAIDAAMGDKT